MILKRVGQYYRRKRQQRALEALYRRYSSYTMIPQDTFVRNLDLASTVNSIPGAVVECGVWRGGMIAAIADVLGADREYVLCDSFQGLPPAKEIDGKKALSWQRNVSDPGYHDNCCAPESIAREAMQLSQATRIRCVPGWFEETLPTMIFHEPIAFLRLDADWYESTMTCLTALYDKMAPGGVIAIDDYHTWDGCSRAVHDFLAIRQAPARISQWNNEVCYIRMPEGIT